MLNQEQTQILEQAIILLFRLRDEQSIENWEEKHERQFTRLFDGIDFIKENGYKQPPVEEVKKMLVNLKIKGSVRERGNGLIEFRNSDFGSVYGRTAAELETKLLEKLKNSADRKSKSAVLFSEFFNETYLPYKRENIKEKSISDIITSFEFIIKCEFDKPLNRYTAESIEKFLYAIPQTRKRQKVRCLFNNVLKYAKKLGKIKSNPCDNVATMKHKSVNGRALSFDMQEKFFDNVANCTKLSVFQKLYLVYVYLTGSRRAEALDVRASDFDLQNNVLHIDGTKTDGSDRFIPLPPLVKKLYACINSLRNKNAKTFFNLKLSQVEKIMKRVADGYHLHDLRHTFGTIAVCVQKLDPKTVSLYMGHSDISMTLKTYTHPEQLDKSSFYDGSLSDDEKLDLLRLKYQGVLSKISAFLDDIPRTYPKIN